MQCGHVDHISGCTTTPTQPSFTKFLSPGVVQRTYQECLPINDNLSVCPSVAPLRNRAQIGGVILTIHIKSALFSIPPCA